MKKIILQILLITTLTIPPLAHSELLNDPGVKNGETSVRVFKFEKEYDEKKFPKKYVEYLPVKVTSRVSKTERDGKEIYTLTNNDELVSGNSHEIVTTMEANPKLKVNSLREREWNPKGELVKDNYFSFINNSYSYPEDVYDIFMLGFVLRGVNFKKGEKSDVNLWLHPALVVHIYIKVVGEDTVTVPAGTFECYKIELTPDVSSLFPISKVLAALIQPFVPSYYFWLAKDHEHVLVKYKGVGGLPGAPQQIAELISLTQEQ